mmetsp:Transcript_8225/g.23627  ORF Transcript_8225/g.23627 Transcript_8225/m.23627 type:complete len:196 (+) Transcript_8225:140-727(+)
MSMMSLSSKAALGSSSLQAASASTTASSGRRTAAFEVSNVTKKLKARPRAAPAKKPAAPKPKAVPAAKKPAAKKTVGGTKMLTKIEELKLLSKVEQAGLLGKLEDSGLTLTAIEKLGLLSTTEKFGVLSLASDRNAPGALNTLALALFAAGPAAVYFIPDDSTALVAAQGAIALVALIGGSAAFGGSKLLSELQG